MRWLFCGTVVAFFAWNATLFYLPGQGFTYLIQFGEKEHARYLPELRAVNHFEMAKSGGYDAQYYAQIAMQPHLSDPLLGKAIGGQLPYRARRILFCWTAWLLAGGHPILALNIYAFQNIACWFLLAGLLLRWFPPVNWGNCARWAGVLFSFGLIFSVKYSLVDGPSLLLIACGLALVESRRPWLGALVLGISGLGKETNILSAAGINLPERRNPQTWAAWLARMALVLLPLAAWMLCLRLWLGSGGGVGARNFGAPFAGLTNKLQDSISLLCAEGYPSVAKFDLLVLAGLLAQFFFFAFRRRWEDPWWRVGASYAVLMVFLGDSVWELYPSAAARVLLPMTLAFNILVPRRGAWLMLLVVGNLGIFASADIFKPPGRESFAIEGPRELRINPKDGNAVGVIYGSHYWYPVERSRWEYWRWSAGDGSVAIHNPQSFTLVAEVKFRLRAVDSRAAIVTCAGKVLWRDMLKGGEVRGVALPEIDLPPGDTVLVFGSDRPATYYGTNDIRRLSYSLRDLEVDLKSRR